MVNSRYLSPEMKAYNFPPSNRIHIPINNKKWWLNFYCAVLGILFFLYLPVYNQLYFRKCRNFFEVVAAVEGWNYNTSRDMRQYILPDKITAVQQPRYLCQTPIFLLIIIFSAVEHFVSRDAIRKTWGSDSLVENVTIEFTFLLGQTENDAVQKKVLAENQKYEDIIQERFIDSYPNLTLKAVMLLKWVNDHCGNKVHYVMKTDDDMYVNVPVLVKMLKSKNKTQDLLIGAFVNRTRPNGDVNHKWYTPKYMYPGRVFPKYIGGAGYVMSHDVVTKLYEAAIFTPLFHLEDVYITGMCAYNAKIKAVHNPAFNNGKIKFDQYIFKEMITAHDLTPEEMDKMYHMLHKKKTWLRSAKSNLPEKPRPQLHLV